MNVKQLIDALKTMPADLPVFAFTEENACSQVERVYLVVEDGGTAAKWPARHSWSEGDKKPNGVGMMLKYN